MIVKLKLYSEGKEVQNMYVHKDSQVSSNIVNGEAPKRKVFNNVRFHINRFEGNFDVGNENSYSENFLVSVVLEFDGICCSSVIERKPR